MKAIKILGLFILVVIIAVAGLAYYAFNNLDRLIVQGVEHYGSEAIGTKVSLEAANVEVQKGRVELSGFQIANPPGFDSQYAFAFNKIITQVDLDQSLLDQNQAITVREITIDGASVIAEQKNLTDTNLTVLAEMLSENSSGTSTAPEEATSESGAARLIKVGSFTFSNANILLITEEWGERDIQLPTISVKNLGGDKGLLPEALATELMNIVLAQAEKAVKKELTGLAKQKVRSELKDRLNEELDDDQKENLNKLKSLFGR